MMTIQAQSQKYMQHLAVQQSPPVKSLILQLVGLSISLSFQLFKLISITASSSLTITSYLLLFHCFILRILQLVFFLDHLLFNCFLFIFFCVLVQKFFPSPTSRCRPRHNAGASYCCVANFCQLPEILQFFDFRIFTNFHFIVHLVVSFMVFFLVHFSKTNDITRVQEQYVVSWRRSKKQTQVKQCGKNKEQKVKYIGAYLTFYNVTLQ